jgi:hypothetical protein
MRYVIWIILLLLPSLSFGYTPPAENLLGRMGTSWEKVKPIHLNAVLQTPEGKLIETIQITVPHRVEQETLRRRDALKAGYLPFAYLTSSSNILKQLLPSLYRNDTKVRLARIGDVICFVLEGSATRLWLRKDDLYPLRSEVRMDDGVWVECRYIDPVQVSSKIAYPDMTQVLREGEPILVERLLGQQSDSPSQ